MRRSLSTLEPNPNAGGAIRWPMRDSFGRVLAYLERLPDRWEVRDSNDQLIYTDTTLDLDQIVVQGRGCMVDDGWEGTHALVAFDANDRTTIPLDASIVPYRLRAFLDRSSLPSDVRALIDEYSVGCGGSFNRSAAAGAGVADPLYDSNDEKYYGEDGVARTYANYNVKAPYKDARYFIINTTGVGGGGIVRGVVQASDLVGLSDEFDYCDPNFVSTLTSPVTTWLHGQLSSTRMWGWFPRRCGSNQPTGTAPTNSSPPTISGTATEGETLTVNPGTWSGSIPINHTYQWRRCDSAGANCVDIAAATATTYTLAAADVAHTIRVREAATNAYGEGSVDSAATAAVKAKQGAIAGTVRSASTGATIASATVNCGNGYSAKTASNGAYSIPSVAPGGYSCAASAKRYRPSTQTVTVASGQTATLNFSLVRR
jgi:hypothetical protein